MNDQSENGGMQGYTAGVSKETLKRMREDEFITITDSEHMGAMGEYEVFVAFKIERPWLVAK